MPHINELSDILHDYFPWNKARLSCFASMLVALFAVRTVNLSQIASALAGEAKESSRYRRVQRFFGEFEFDYHRIAAFIFRLFCFEQGQWYLTMDRTNWQWGKKNINILMLAVAYKGIAVPIL